MQTKRFTQEGLMDFLSKERLVFLIISQKNCAPCQTLHRILDQKLPKNILQCCYLLNLEDHLFLKEQFQILSTPNIFIYSYGNRIEIQGQHGHVDRIVGFHSTLDLTLCTLYKIIKNGENNNDQR